MSESIVIIHVAKHPIFKLQHYAGVTIDGTPVDPKNFYDEFATPKQIRDQILASLNAQNVQVRARTTDNGMEYVCAVRL